MSEEETYLDGRVVVKTGDITKEKVDAIVNAANSSLMGGGGVDGAIHRAGGPAILEECKRVRKELFPEGLPTGRAVATTAGEMPARRVIHTAGPVYKKGAPSMAELLADCYRNSLEVAAREGLETIAFPAISTGVYGYPKDEAAEVASRAIEGFLRENEPIREVRLVFFGKSDKEVFAKHCVWS